MDCTAFIWRFSSHFDNSQCFRFTGRNLPIVTRNILTLVAATTAQEHIAEIVLDLLFLGRKKLR